MSSRQTSRKGSQEMSKSELSYVTKRMFEKNRQIISRLPFKGTIINSPRKGRSISQ
jgi:hypothetical protein